MTVTVGALSKKGSSCFWVDVEVARTSPMLTVLPATMRSRLVFFLRFFFLGRARTTRGILDVLRSH